MIRNVEGFWLRVEGEETVSRASRSFEAIHCTRECCGWSSADTAAVRKGFDARARRTAREARALPKYGSRDFGGAVPPSRERYGGTRGHCGLSSTQSDGLRSFAQLCTAYCSLAPEKFFLRDARKASTPMSKLPEKLPNSYNHPPSRGRYGATRHRTPNIQWNESNLTVVNYAKAA